MYKHDEVQSYHTKYVTEICGKPNLGIFLKACKILSRSNLPWNMRSELSISFQLQNVWVENIVIKN